MSKHRRAARIHADDGGGHKLLVAMEFKSTNGLMLDEVREVRTRLARAIALELAGLPYTDFGPDNVQVNLLRKL